jgi:hypothetical protein
VGAELQLADLTHAKLAGVRLDKCNLTEAQLVRVTLDHPDRNQRTSLRSCNLTGANLRQAGLRNADLTGAMLAGAAFQQTELTDSTLELAVGLVEEQLSGTCGEGQIDVFVTRSGGADGDGSAASRGARDSSAAGELQHEADRVDEPRGFAKRHVLDPCLRDLLAKLGTKAEALRKASEADKQGIHAEVDDLHQQSARVDSRVTASPVAATSAPPVSGTPKLSRVEVLYVPDRRRDAEAYRTKLRSAGIATTSLRRTSPCYRPRARRSEPVPRWFSVKAKALSANR